MIGIPLGLAYSNFGEWLLHKYVLHGLGRHRDSFWSFHWHEHHQKSRKHGMVDDQYGGPLWRWAPQTKELFGLALIALGHLPLLRFAPFFTAAVWLSEVNYYRVHRRAHLDPEWARRHLPWHHDHHMGRDQNANWCVTHPLFDYVMGTRRKYLGAREEQPGPACLAAPSSPGRLAGARPGNGHRAGPSGVHRFLRAPIPPGGRRKEAP